MRKSTKRGRMLFTGFFLVALVALFCGVEDPDSPFIEANRIQKDLNSKSPLLLRFEEGRLLVHESQRGRMVIGSMAVSKGAADLLIRTYKAAGWLEHPSEGAVVLYHSSYRDDLSLPFRYLED